MRAYKFLNAHFGLKSLYEKRLKISRLDELNDPFEFLPFDLSNRSQRWAARTTRDQIAEKQGILCFSSAWHDPVIWAHYSDKHRGLCLGFELPHQDIAKVVRYVSERLPFPDPPTMADAEAMLFTKFSNWQYEQEIRVWAQLNDEEDGMYYSDFSDTLRLVEVIAGANCTVPRIGITRALGPAAEHVAITKARAGFTRFEVVADQRGFKAIA
jgi:hypothetical protein